MKLLDALEINNTITNTKGGEYYKSSYDANLDLFCAVSRFQEDNEIEDVFYRAYKEDKNLAVANILNFLDIRGGKGERRVFKVCFSKLISLDKEMALKVLSFIPELGRYDYILEGIDTCIQDSVLEMIQKQLKEDIESSYPSLLAKWLPSLRTHNVNSSFAKKLAKLLNMTEKEYRKTLSSLRSKINIVEKNLTEKTYDKIDFSKVPAKAMLKYENCFANEIKDRYEEYLESLEKGETKVNTGGLFVNDIIKRVYYGDIEKTLVDAMWTSQKDVLKGVDKNILVVADTSGSMFSFGGLPYFTSIGLAIYTAERNKGVFHDRFISFSMKPTLQKVEGETIVEKIHNIKSIVANTDIDKVFELILNTMTSNNLSSDELPSHIVIISDMEFDDGVHSKGGTNFSGWKKAFEEAGFKLPTIIFWNVAGETYGVPVTKHDNDVALISGYSTNVLEKLFNLDEYNPIDSMIEILNKYLELIK